MTSPRISLRICPGCRGTWFRPVPLWRYRHFRHYRHFIGDALVDDIPAAMTVLVCLCGLPQFPALSGVRSPTTERETSSLLDCLHTTHQHRPRVALPERHSDWRLHHADLVRFQQLADRADTLQDGLAAVSGPLTGRYPFGRRRWRHPSRRAPDSRGRDPLVIGLQRAGVPFRQANRAIDTLVKRSLYVFTALYFQDRESVYLI